jgi:hypothetical protein
MILKAGDPGSTSKLVIDTVTGERLMAIGRVDTETGEAWGAVLGPDGRFKVKGLDLVIEKHPNPVRVIERGGVEDRMRTRVQEELAASGKRYQAFLGAFVLGLNPECTESTFPLDLGLRCGAWEVTFKRTAWGAEEGQP